MQCKEWQKKAFWRVLLSNQGNIPAKRIKSNSGQDKGQKRVFLLSKLSGFLNNGPNSRFITTWQLSSFRFRELSTLPCIVVSSEIVVSSRIVAVISLPPCTPYLLYLYLYIYLYPYPGPLLRGTLGAAQELGNPSFLRALFVDI